MEKYRKQFIEDFEKRFNVDLKNKQIEQYWFEFMHEKDKEIENLKKDLEYVMEQSYGAFAKQWCIDWNFTEIREKYNIPNKLESDK